MTAGVAAPPLRGRSLTWAWFLTVTVAEVLGFAVPAVAGALVADATAVVVLTVVPLAGAVEGALLGAGQALVLRRALPGLPVRRWIAMTSLAAVVAYLVGLLPSAAVQVWSGWPAAVSILVAAMLGIVLLGSIGTAQWTILRSYVTRAGRWIVATAAAWIAGLAVFLIFTMPLWQPGQPISFTVGVGVIGGLLMAATTAALTGLALRRLVG
jgi:hypothetical protein